MSLDRRVLCARRSRHLREAPEHIDPPDDRTRQAGARPRPNPKRPWELMSRPPTRLQLWLSLTASGSRSRATSAPACPAAAIPTIAKTATTNDNGLLLWSYGAIHTRGYGAPGGSCNYPIYLSPAGHRVRRPRL